MIFWGLLFLIFGAVSIETQSWLPLIIAGIAWLIAQPFERPLTATIRAGGLSPEVPHSCASAFLSLLLYGSMILVLVAIVTNWRG